MNFKKEHPYWINLNNVLYAYPTITVPESSEPFQIKFKFIGGDAVYSYPSFKTEKAATRYLEDLLTK